MTSISEETMLNQLREEKNASFEMLYTSCFPSVSAHITRHGGNRADAEDVFQEAIIVLLHKIRQPEFKLTSSLKTYLFAINRNIWLKRLRDNKVISVEDISIYQQESRAFETEPEPAKEEKLSKWLTKITKNCQRILKAIFFYHEPIESLMQKMGWKNKHSAANQQYKCMQQLRKEKQLETKG
jgi:RNA polymerase sigma factor (sigma-70 family)